MGKMKENNILLHYKCRYCGKMFINDGGNKFHLLDALYAYHLCENRKYGIGDLISMETEKEKED